MYLLLIARSIPKRLFFELKNIVKKLSDYKLSEKEMFLFLESSDMGKKYTILYNKTKENAYKIFWKTVSDNNIEKYVKYWSNDEFCRITSRECEIKEILSKFSDFKDANISMFDKKRIYIDLHNAIKNTELSKEEKIFLEIPEFKKIKKYIKKYNKAIDDLDNLLKLSNESINKDILSKINKSIKCQKTFLQEIRSIENLITYIEKYDSFNHPYNKLIQNLSDITKIINKISKSCNIIDKSISKLKKSELFKEESKILSEIGKIVAVEGGFVKYEDTVFNVIDLEDELDLSELKEILERIANSIYDSFYEYEAYIIHKNIGWQQLCLSYIYRGFMPLSKLNFCDTRPDIIGQYNILKEYLNAASHTFTLPLFAYMLFAVNKSLFSSTPKKFAVNIKSPYDIEPSESVIEYVSRLNMNFMSLAVDLKDGFPTDFSKEFNISRCFTNPFYLKGSKYKLKDFPVFLYEHKTKRKIRKLSVSAHNNFKNAKKEQRKINNPILQKDINSQISYIFFNLDNSEKDLLNIFINEDILSNILNTELPKSSDEKFGFRNIIKDYIFYISNILSNEVKKLDEEYKSKIIKKIHNEFDIDGDNISKGIYKFMMYMLKDYKRDQITVEFSSYLDERIHKLSLNQLEDIGMGFNKCENDDAKLIFTSRFRREYHFNYIPNDNEEIIFSKNDYWYWIEDFKEDMADAAVDRYHMLLINEYIYTQNYTPKYFNNLFSIARKYIKDNLKGKRYDTVQAARGALLLAAIMSFRSYIDEHLPDNSNDFELYFQKFIKIIIQMCCTLPTVYIDSNNSLPEFADFLKLQMDNNAIIDAESGTDSKIGWIDRKKNKIYLKNDSGNNFYDKFTKYLIDRNKHIELSKQAFVRDVLEEKGILSARFAGGGKRYDYERKIGDKKYRVLVLDCELLKI